VYPDRSEAFEAGTVGADASASDTVGNETSEENLDERSERERSERCAREPDDIDDATLARVIASDLGEDNVHAIRKLVAMFPRAVLDEALRRTLAIPGDRVRSTRGAIFTGIVRKLAAEPGVATHSPSRT
jgi:hypothetical protein